MNARQAKPTQEYAAIRENKDAGYNWIDTATFDCTREGAEKKAKNTDNDIPWWAVANPIVDIVLVNITVA